MRFDVWVRGCRMGKVGAEVWMKWGGSKGSVHCVELRIAKCCFVLYFGNLVIVCWSGLSRGGVDVL